MSNEIRQSVNARRLDLKKTLAILKQSETPEAARQMLEDPTELELCRRAALARAFDREMFDSVLAAGLDLSEPATVFERFIQRPGIERIPRTKGLYRFKDSSREEFLKAWKTGETKEGEIPTAQAAFTRTLVDYYRKRQGGDPEEKLDLLAGLSLVDQAQAKELFILLYDEADRRFDLPSCQTALRILENRYSFLRDDLRRTLHDRRRYYRSRSLYASEYYQTISYYPRDNVLAQFQELVKHPSKWIFHLYATGGMGKTMFLRWLASRYCAPEPQRIPVARLDFDFIHLPLVQEYPWLLLQPLAAQLNEQIDGAPFSELLEGSDGLRQFAPLLRQLLRFEPERIGEEAEDATRKNEAVWRNYVETHRNEREQAESRLRAGAASWARQALDRFNSALSESKLKTPLVIILDTLEEMTLTQSAALMKILENLASIHSAYRHTRLILAGRYDLRERISEFKALYGNQAECLELAKFSKEQAIGYLAEKRRLKGEKLLEAIYERADEGNPFKLALFADWVSSRQAAGEQLTEQDARDLPSADFAYLIDRIVRRLPEQEMRWVLRYGAVPRRLTREFFEQVMLKYLKRVIAEPELDRPNENMPEEARLYEGRPIWLDLSPGNDQLAIDNMWERLRQYASGYGWVTYESHSDSFTFHSEVRAPIRKLLSRQEVYRLLQEDAVIYFENRARDDQGDWAEWKSEAFHHLFQLDAARATDYWRENLNSSRCEIDPAARKQLAKEILKPGYEEADLSNPNLNAEYLALSTVVQACVALAADPKRRISEWSEARQHLDLLTQRYPNRDDESHLLARIADRLTRYRNAEALPLIEQILSHEIAAETRLSLEFQLAELMNEMNLPDAGKHYGAAIDIAAEGKWRFPPERLIRRYFARWLADRGEFTLAEREYRRALDSELTDADRYKTRIRLADLYLNHSQVEKAERCAQEIAKLKPGSLTSLWRFRFSRLRARIELAFYDPFKAFEIAQDAEQLSGDAPSLASRLELLGQISAELMDFEQALPLIEDAKKMWMEIGDDESQYRCYLLSAETQFYGVGNLKETSDCIDEWMRFAPHHRCEPELRLRLIDVALKHRYDRRAEAVELWRETLSRVKDSPRLTALALASGLARGLANRADVLELLDNLKRVEPPEARLAALEPFRKFAEENTGEPASTLEIDERARKKLIECVTPLAHNRKGRGFVARAVAISYFYLWLGVGKEAVELLEAAEDKAENIFDARAVARARDNLEKSGISAGRGSKLLIHSLEAINNLRAAILIEDAERLLRQGKQPSIYLPQGKTLSLYSLLTDLHAFLSVNSPTQLSARLEELQGRILLSQGDSSGRDYITTAATIYARLNDRLKEQRVIRENAWQLDQPTKGARTGDLVSPPHLSPDFSPPMDEFPSCVITFDLERDKERFLSSDLLHKMGKRPGQLKRTPIDERLRYLRILPEAFQPSFSLFDSDLQSWLSDGLTMIGREMGDFLITPDEMDEIRETAGGFDLQLNIPHSPVAALPWELAQTGPNRLLTQIFQSISRTSRQPAPWRAAIKWAQTTANLFLDKSIRVDGIIGPITRTAIKELQRLMGIDEPDEQISRETIQKIREAQSMAMKGAGLRAVIVRPDDAFSAQQYRGFDPISDLDRFYSRGNIETLTFSPTRLRDLEKELAELRPQILHLVVRMEQEGRGGNISIDLGDRFSGVSGGFGAREINRILKKIPDDSMRPLVILDVNMPPGMTEAIRQLLLRNQFATQLFNLENTGGVLATGLAFPKDQEKILNRLVSGLEQRQSLGSIVSEIHKLSSWYPGNMMEYAIGTHCAALLTLDPGLSIIPEPAQRNQRML